MDAKREAREREAPTPDAALVDALKGYHIRNPGDLKQPASWLGSTLWAHDLVDKKPTREETQKALMILEQKSRRGGRKGGGAV